MEKELDPITAEARQALIDDGIEAEAIDAYIELGTGDDDLSDFTEAYVGEYKNDADFTQNLIEDMGVIPADLPSYIHIDWKRTAFDIMLDYSEQDGYYFRNL